MNHLKEIPAAKDENIVYFKAIKGNSHNWYIPIFFECTVVHSSAKASLNIVHRIFDTKSFFFRRQDETLYPNNDKSSLNLAKLSIGS